MRLWILERLNHIGILRSAEFLSYLIMFALIAFISFALWLIVRAVTGYIIDAVVRRTKSRWDDVFLQNGVFRKTSAVVVPITILSLAHNMQPYETVFVKTGNVFGVFVAVTVIVSALRSVSDIYNMYEVAKIRPIRSVVQVVQVCSYIIGGISAAAILLGQNPLTLLGGIGAMTAVTTLIFKDAILGFVSGIQLTGNDMIRIGDWIEMPKCNANGVVTDLSMTTVKVENFDKTITSIPAYTMVSDAFINWRGMVSAGARRIKRSIYINASDVRFCDTEMTERFHKITFLSEYMEERLAEIELYNTSHEIDMGEIVNGRRLTNLGVFRVYITGYLKGHPKISKDMLCMTRQLELIEQGIPLEIYAFANTTEWTEYEGIQSDIFDHIYAVAREFGLRIYQKPSASEFEGILKAVQKS